MDRPRSPRRRPEAPSAPTTITELARRYHSCAVALARSFGLPLTADFLQAYHGAISCVYIEAGRAGVRLAPTVPLPPLTGALDVPAAQANGLPVELVSPLKSDVSANGDTPPVTTPPVTTPPVTTPPDTPEASILGCTGGLSPTPEAPPTTIPKEAGLPCAGVTIADLKPAQLAMLISKTAALMHGEDRDQWVGLLSALQSERAARMARGRRPAVEGPANGA